MHEKLLTKYLLFGFERTIFSSYLLNSFSFGSGGDLVIPYSLSSSCSLFYRAVLCSSPLFHSPFSRVLIYSFFSCIRVCSVSLMILIALLYACLEIGSSDLQNSRSKHLLLRVM